MKRDANFKTILNGRKTIKTVWIALNLICLILSLIGAASAQTQEKHYVTLEDGRRYPVEAPEIVRHRIEEAKRQAGLSVHPQQHFALSSPPETYSLAQYQTAFQDQGTRGTCWAFAGAAALEAAYRRKYNLQLDLSEQYIFHMSKAMALHGGIPENNTSLTGFQGSSDIVGHMTKYAVPEERFAPYLDEIQMDQLRLSLGVGDMVNAPTQIGYDTFEFSEGHIPTTARWAARYRVTSFGRVSDPTDSSQLEAILAANKEVVVRLKLQWKYDAAKDLYEFDPDSPDGGHVMMLTGYDRHNGLFYAKNSWGENRFIRLTYNFISKCASSAHYINDVSDPNGPLFNKARFLGFHDIDERIGDVRLNGRVLIRRFTRLEVDETPELELGTFYPSDGSAPLRISGFFINNGDGVTLKIHYSIGGQSAFHTITYHWGFWRFVDKYYTGTPQVGTLEHPLTNFWLAVQYVPRKGAVILQPGNHYAVGTYSKPMTIKAHGAAATLGR